MEENIKIEQLIEEREKQKEEQKAKNELTAVNEEMPNFVAEVDKTKDLEEQASDVVKLIGAKQMSQNQSFMDKVAENFGAKVLTEQETTQMQKEMLLAEQYFIKWKEVLKLVHMKEAQGLGLMKTCIFFMLIPYLILRVIGFCFMCISETFEFFNTLFNAVFGDGGKILVDKNGQALLDPKTNEPFKTNAGYNLFAKILLGFIIIAVLLALIFVFVNVFTGFDVFKWFRTVL